MAAVQFLTRVPLKGSAPGLEAAVVWLPVVGFLLGGGLAAVDAGLRWLGASALLDSTLLVVLLLALTGGLHADGLADVADAVFGHASPERRLEIMRDPRTGAFGVIALVSVVALKIASLESLDGGARLPLLVMAPALGRWSIVLLASAFPYGRPHGLGAPLKSAATPAALVIASVLPVLGCFVAGRAGIVAGLLAVLTALGLGRWLMRLLPGLTGDCYGAACELVETVVWLGGALLLPRLP